MQENSDQPSSLAITKRIAELLARGEMGVVVTIVSGQNTGAKVLVHEDGAVFGSFGELDSVVSTQATKFLASRNDTLLQDRFLFERLQPQPRLVVCGAGHVGASLAKLGAFLGYQTALIDDRAEFLERDRFANVPLELVAAKDWGTAVREVIGNGRGVSVAVVTRGHSEDEQCMRAVVQASPDYVGLIGSKRRTSIVIERLRETGTPEEALRNIHAPIGLDIGAISPEEVALAIMAEIVAARRGGTGAPLSAWRRK
jgi:xanthine dehydrogenase accessory factor